MRRRKTQSEIFEAALSVYARYGFGKSTLEDIAGKLEMTKSSLYLYARSKEDLYDGTIRFALNRWQDYVNRKISGVSGTAEKLRTLFTSAFAYLSLDEEFRTILHGDPTIFSIDPERDRYRDINEKAVLMIREILETGIAEGVFREIPADETARYLFSIYIMFIIRTYIYSEGISAGSLFNRAVDININGLLKKQE